GSRAGARPGRGPQVRGHPAEGLGQAGELQQQQSPAGGFGSDPAHRRRRGKSPGVREDQGADPLAVAPPCPSRRPPVSRAGIPTRTIGRISTVSRRGSAGSPAGGASASRGGSGASPP